MGSFLTQSCLNCPKKTLFHSVTLHFCQMGNSQVVLIKLEARIHTDSLNIIKVFSCYCSDNIMNLTVVKFKLILKFCFHENISVGLNMPLPLATVTGKIRVGSCSACDMEHLSKVCSQNR